MPVPGCNGDDIRILFSADFCVDMKYMITAQNLGAGYDHDAEAEEEAATEEEGWEESGFNEELSTLLSAWEVATGSPSNETSLPPAANSTGAPTDTMLPTTMVPSSIMAALDADAAVLSESETTGAPSLASTNDSASIADYYSETTAAPSLASTNDSASIADYYSSTMAATSDIPLGQNTTSPSDTFSDDYYSITTSAPTEPMPHLRMVGNDGIYDTYPLYQCQGGK